MRVAFVTARPPYPLNAGGRIRTFHLLGEVSRIHDVTLVTATEGEDDLAALHAIGGAMSGIALRTVMVPRRAAMRSRLGQVRRTMVGPLPFTWASYCNRRFRDHVRAALQERPYDLVHCDHVQVAHAFEGLDTPPRLLNAHNIESVILRRLALQEPASWKRALVAWQAAKARRAEARAHRCFDRSVVVSEVDRAELERISPGRMISIVPNGVDPAWLEPVAGADPSRTMVFLGQMDWLPNIDAVSVFVRRVLPKIRRDVPEAELWVVGRNPPRSLVSLCAAAGVHVTGTVDDVRPFVARARLVVVPLRIGGGTRLKILEAWAMRKAVLSTAVGAEGLPAVDGENIALADDPEAMAARAVSLLRDSGEADRLGDAGRQVVEEQFTWPRVALRLFEAYDQTVRDGVRNRGSGLTAA